MWQLWWMGKICSIHILSLFHWWLSCQYAVQFNIKHYFTAGLDTSALSKQYTIQSSEHKYVLNFCGGASGTQQKCNGTTDFGVCQILGDGTEVLAGKKNDMWVLGICGILDLCDQILCPDHIDIKYFITSMVRIEVWRMMLDVYVRWWFSVVMNQWNVFYVLLSP